ncbi:hypothetical protein F8M41_000392 [Gigaspora margarita]|uniref:Uncharacterized protein n=1 Tax=Gigaspora margarita TaxID=4874 RepID=A0A8H3XG44_GIGMA|nr:hypothetical protein F8M41_000392 [Gigaspora margarita]
MASLLYAGGKPPSGGAKHLMCGCRYTNWVESWIATNNQQNICINASKESHCSNIKYKETGLKAKASLAFREHIPGFAPNPTHLVNTAIFAINTNPL